MRLFFISLVIAVTCLLPQIAEVKDWQLPGFIGTLTYVPAAGLGYMTVFFHELGHTVVAWSYGQPTVPAFNFRDGGGVAVPFMERSWFLQIIVYLGALAAGAWLLKEGVWSLLGALVALVIVHASFASGGRYELPINYFGNGGAVVMGCYCIWRAALGKNVGGSKYLVEQYINMIFGLFAVSDEGLFLGWKLAASDVARAAYDEGIGASHMANDFSVIANRLDAPLSHVGEFHLFFTIACLAVTGFLVFQGLQEQTEDASEDEAAVMHRLPRRKP